MIELNKRTGRMVSATGLVLSVDSPLPMSQIPVDWTPFSEFRVVETNRWNSEGHSELLVFNKQNTEYQMGASIQISPYSDSGFYEIATLRGASSCGILSHDYDRFVPSYDTLFGLHVGEVPFLQDFISLSEYQLFSPSPLRVLLVDDELMFFGDAIPEGSNGYHYKRLIRGVLGSPIQDHKKGTQVWACDFSFCSIWVEETGKWFLKSIASVNGKLTLQDSPIIPVCIRNKGSWIPSPILLSTIRNQNDVSISWAGRYIGLRAFDRISPDITPFENTIECGEYIVKIDRSISEVIKSTNLLRFYSKPKKYEIQHRVDGRISSPLTFTF